MTGGRDRQERLRRAIEIDLVPEFVRPWFRTKNVCLSMTDWRAFGDVLAQQYPFAVYIRGATGPERISKELPAIRAERHLNALINQDGILPGEVEICFDPNWRPDFYHAEDGGWRRRPMNLPHLRIMPATRIWPSKENRPDYIATGRIEFSCEPGNKKHLALARQFFGLLKKVSSNKNQLVVHFPSYKVAQVYDKNSDIWIGHDAVRWAREDPKRLLAFELTAMSVRTPDNLGYGRRPNDEGTIGLPAQA